MAHGAMCASSGIPVFTSPSQSLRMGLGGMCESDDNHFADGEDFKPTVVDIQTNLIGKSQRMREYENIRPD
jgi:hypothetical protein